MQEISLRVLNIHHNQYDLAAFLRLHDVLLPSLLLLPVKDLLPHEKHRGRNMEEIFLLYSEHLQYLKSNAE